MSDPLEQARQAFVHGIAQFEGGQYDAADAAFTQALTLAPGRASVLLNLGVTKVHRQLFAEAEPLLQAALAADDALGEGWAALGLAQMELGHWAPALRSHENAVARGAGNAAVHMRLGQCLARAGRTSEALAALQAAVEMDANLAEAWSQLGHLRRDLQQPAEAARCYRNALERGADAELHRYYLAALQHGEPVANAPRQYVQTLFDQYAEDFEDHLVGELRYQGHRVLVEQLPAACPPWFEQVLDLGCGTGLCGPHIRPRAGALWGVDLSAAMLGKARARGVYDHLIEADLVEALRSEGVQFDLVLAADVFIYVGHLEDAFAQLARRVRPGGWLAFTIEESDADGAGAAAPQLLPSLRYAHTTAYVHALAERHGFRRAHVHSAPLRWDQATGVAGKYVYLQKN
ncbi:tetratricopeptide repeat protein [Paracidovorax sp. MALMAid1276]|uniref:tetratricopeptide repeat protein n=1 Tax=Paracidovorax sp. MALMAid1276 TaxID=3411631 RepID=UPI003B9DC509